MADEQNMARAEGDAIVRPVAGISDADVQRIAQAVTDRLLVGTGIVPGVADDVGVAPAFRLGTAYQNYLIWAARNGAGWALADPNTMVRMAVMLTAMAKLGEGATPQQLAYAAQAALEGLPQ